MTFSSGGISIERRGTEFLEALPAHWELRPAVSLARVLTSNIDKISVHGQVRVHLCNYTDVYYSDEVTEGRDFMPSTATQEQARLFAVRAGDVAITKDSETADDIGISAYVPRSIPDLVYGYHLAIYRPHDIRYGKFLKWMFDSSYAKAYFETRTFGVTRVGLSQNTLRYFRMPTPCPEEAKAISDYLDVETAEFDAFINDQEELIRLLGERRKAGISQAVGIASENRVEVGRLIESIDQGWSPECENRPAEEGDWGVLKVGCVNGGQFDARQNKALPSDQVPKPQLTVRRDDVLVSRGNTRELVGSAATVLTDHPTLMLSDLVYRIRTRRDALSPAYLSLALSTAEARSQLEAKAKGTSSSMQKLSQKDIRTTLIPLPSLPIQEETVANVCRATAEIDAAIEQSRDAIALLRERRAAMISAAVTGKIDVRERAGGRDA